VCSPGTILTSRSESIGVDPSNCVDASVMSVLDLDSGGGRRDVPNKEVLVEASGCKVNIVGGPSDRVDTGGMEHPTIHLELFGSSIPHNDLAICVGGSQMFSVGRVGNAGERTTMAFDFVGLGERVSADRVNINVVVSSSNSNF